jgi:hypothetical protein
MTTLVFQMFRNFIAQIIGAGESFEILWPGLAHILGTIPTRARQKNTARTKISLETQ